MHSFLPKHISLLCILFSKWTFQIPLFILLKIIKDLFFLFNALFLRTVFRVTAVSFKNFCSIIKHIVILIFNGLCTYICNRRDQKGEAKKGDIFWSVQGINVLFCIAAFKEQKTQSNWLWLQHG